MDHLGQVAQFITAVVLAFNCWQSWRNGKKANAISEGQAEINKNVATLEKNTNSIKDALVAATAKAALAEGTAAGLKQGRNEPRT